MACLEIIDSLSKNFFYFLIKNNLISISINDYPSNLKYDEYYTNKYYTNKYYTNDYFIYDYF